MTRQFTGWHFTAIIVAFFGVVIAVNIIMATLAVRTFGGVVVENSYVASQEYNGWLAKARRQERLGWHVRATLDESRHVAVSLAPKDAELSGFARHPLGREADIPLIFTTKGGGSVSDRALPAGRWQVHLHVRRGPHEARSIEVLQ